MTGLNKMQTFTKLNLRNNTGTWRCCEMCAGSRQTHGSFSEPSCFDCHCRLPARRSLSISVLLPPLLLRLHISHLPLLSPRSTWLPTSQPLSEGGGRRAAWMRDSGAALLCSREGMGRCAPHQPVAASGRPHDMHTADPLAPLVSLF